jgi:dTDP-4-amino-4,6-dideoxygalactose transaminase
VLGNFALGKEKMIALEDVELSTSEELAMIQDSFQDVLRHRQYVLGPEVESLENLLAAWFDTQYAVGCNSGFGAYLLSLLALNIGRGKRVVVPAFAPAPYLGIITRRGAIPVLVDVAQHDFHLSPSALGRVMDKSIDAIVVHHLFGGTADMRTIMSLAGKVPTIEVLTYSLGAHIGEHRAGTFGTLATSCLREETTLAAHGDAGMIWTANPDMNEKLRRIRQEDASGSLCEDYISANFHQDTVHAAILLRKFDRWSRLLEARKQHSLHLSNAIKGQQLSEIIVPEFYTRNATHFVVFAEKRDELVAYLQSRGISARAWWPIPVYQQPGFRGLGCKKGDFPEAERAAAMSISLPFSFDAAFETDRLISELTKFYRT